MSSEIEALKAERKALFDRIVAANNLLAKIPLRDRVVYCGSCGKALKVAADDRLKPWLESVRQALLFPSQGPEQHPQCPKCGSYHTKEILLPANQVPSEFYASTDYKCLNCGIIWVSGDYVSKSFVEFHGVAGQ
jgi:predicted RNA-binding Zn-ribbon protein involved in translation (DUF1610 family)